MSDILPVYPDTVVASLKSEQGGFFTTNVELEPVSGMSICDVTFFDLAGSVIQNPSYVLATVSSRFDGTGNASNVFRYAVCPESTIESATLYSTPFTTTTFSNPYPYFSSATMLLTRGVDYTSNVTIRITGDYNDAFSIDSGVEGLRCDVTLQFLP